MFANREAELEWLAIFSLSGFTDELRAAAKHGVVTLISAEELLRRP